MKYLNPISRLCALFAASAALALAPLAVRAADTAQAGESTTVTGEVLDMACYLDHGAHGEKHADCAKMCISSGLPVGIKSADGTVYLLIGEHKPANAMLADYAAKTVTVRGKLATRDGMNLLENIEIVK